MPREEWKDFNLLRNYLGVAREWPSGFIFSTKRHNFVYAILTESWFDSKQAYRLIDLKLSNILT